MKPVTTVTFPLLRRVVTRQTTGTLCLRFTPRDAVRWDLSTDTSVGVPQLQPATSGRKAERKP